MKSLFILFLVAFLFWGGYRIVVDIHAKQGYIGYLKRAADANSIELAKTELTKAIAEIERRELTSGYTSILWRTPDEDLGFWYTNLKTSLKELLNLPETSSSLEKSNMLIKLRETLLDSTKEGDDVTYPDGISVFPNNGIIAIWGWGSIILAILFLILWGKREDFF